jgi:hypothetical protein
VEKAPLKKGPQNVHKGQLPILRRRISDPMWTISRCCAGQYMTISGVQVTASYMRELVIDSWEWVGMAARLWLDGATHT